MKITIQQCLHGYSNGHQLLASSTDLAPDVRRVLLFQSDLSGPKPQSGFETYLTAYPISGSNFFAFARTWYASEMPRPGCVWTQTLLIELADLGKIPEPLALLQNFTRPKINAYQAYEKEFLVDFSDLLLSYDNSRSEKYDLISDGLYSKPDKSIVLDSLTSEFYENAILEIWADQWPRLRRNFSFCTGALSLKSLTNKLFDLQIVPQKSSNSIIRGNTAIEVVNSKSKYAADWLNVIHSAPKNQLRQFLWMFGADMAGERSNFPKLIELYAKLNEPKANLSSLNNVIKDILPLPENGKSFKNSVFGKSSNIRNFTEIEVLRFLLSEPNVQHLSLADYDLTNRLLDILSKDKIGLPDFFDMLSRAIPGRFDERIYENIEIPILEAVDFLQSNNYLIESSIKKNIEIAYLKNIWHTDLNTQRQFLNAIVRNSEGDLPSQILEIVLESKSNIIFDIEKMFGLSAVEYSLNWFNVGLNQLLPDWRDRIFNHYYEFVGSWVSKNIKNAHPKILLQLFQYTSPEAALRLNFDHHVWIEAYAKLKKSEGVDLQYIASLFLSKGLRNSMYGSDWIVSMTFQDVYQFAERSELSRHWGLIPKDMDDQDERDDFGPIEMIFKLFGLNSKRTKDVQSWDYCEILLRTVSNKYAKNNWSPQSYLETFKNESIFKKSVSFLLTKRRGTDFINKVKNNLFKSKKITGKPFQKKILTEIASK